MPVAQQSRDTFVQAAAVTPDALTAFDAYADLLARWQARINLVGPQTLETLWRRHFLELGRSHSKGWRISGEPQAAQRRRK